MKDDYRERLIQKFTARDTFKGAIMAKCVECVFDEEAEGSWRQQVEECLGYDCPLYSKRPIRGKQ